MIQMYELYFENQEALDIFKKELKEELNGKEEAGYILFCSFLDDMLKRSISLQKYITKNISDDLICCVNLPYKIGDNFDSVGFSLAAKSGRKVKKREEMMFKSYCDKFFGDVIGLESLFDNYFS